ncbi:hypothetical protein JCM14469_31290 [Desulfatiferula olefinivorans]
MMIRSPLIRVRFLLFTLLFFPPGCALWGPPVHSPGVDAVLARIDAAGTAVNTVNGLGELTLTDGPQKTRFRLGWAAGRPDRLRLVVLFSGRPVETLVYDGRVLSLVSHTGEHDPVIRRKRNPDLERLTTLPLTTDRIIAYLTGRVPIMPHRSGTLAPAPGGGSVLTLYRCKDRVVQTVDLDAGGRVAAFDIYDRKGTHHHVRPALGTAPDGTSTALPELIRIERDDRTLTIRVDQINPNPDLSADTFKIPDL